MLAALVSGCTMMTSDEVIPRDGPTMREIYAGHMGGGTVRGDRAGVAVGLRERAMASGSVNLAGYTRIVHNEIDNQFERLPNPDLVMFVFPHLAGPARTPVPGYATVFPMYSRPAYALPGETVPY